MASSVYPQFVEALANAAVDYRGGDFRAMLVSQDASAFTDIAHVQAVEIDGDGYTAGGVPVDVTVDRDVITLGPVSLAPATITASGAVYYCLPGLLVAFIDFGEPVASVNGPFTVTPSVVEVKFVPLQ